MRVQKGDDYREHFLTTIDTNFTGMRTSIGQIIHEQGDIRKIVEELARRMPCNTGPVPGVPHLIVAAQGQTLTDAGVAMQLEIEDLKTKVTRLIEQSSDHSTQIGLLDQLKERVDLAEGQILKWRRRRPDLTDEDDSTVVTAVEAQEQLLTFERKIRDVGN